MSNVDVFSRTQILDINPSPRIDILSRTQKIIVNSPSSVNIINAGPIGPRGITGEQGEQGLGGFYKHTQVLALTVWLVTHNLGYEPAGIDAYELVAPDIYVRVVGIIVHLNNNAFTIQYDIPISGYVNAS